jgi:hypothetical protein
MAALFRLFSAPARVPPPAVVGDDIYPAHMLDDTKTLRGIVVTWTLRFNDVLDPEKLHSSLSKLLELGDWKKVGGRMRLNVSMPSIYFVTATEFSRKMAVWSFMCLDLSPRIVQPCFTLMRL